VCIDAPMCYWVKGSDRRSKATVFCPGFGNLPFCHFLIFQRLVQACEDQQLILMDLRWYSIHAFAPRQPSWSTCAAALRCLLETKHAYNQITLIGHSGGAILANKLVNNGCKVESVVLMDPPVFNPPWTGSSVNSFRFPATWACGCSRSGIIWDDTPCAIAYSRCAKVTVLVSQHDILVPPRTALHFLTHLYERIGPRLQVVIDPGANHGAACLEPLRPAVGAAIAHQGMSWQDVKQELHTNPLPTDVSAFKLVCDLVYTCSGCVCRTLWGMGFSRTSRGKSTQQEQFQKKDDSPALKRSFVSQDSQRSVRRRINHDTENEIAT